MITQAHQEFEGADLVSSKAAGGYKSNLDTIAVLKRVEQLKKWQEDEKMKLLQAHEDQMQQFRIEQERITKHLPEATTSEQHLFQKSTNSKPKFSYDDLYSESETPPIHKELQTSTDSGYTNSEGHFSTHNSSEMTASTKIKVNAAPQYCNTSGNDLDDTTADSSLSEQDMKLVKLITNQIRMKKINLEAFVDDDDFEIDDFEELRQESKEIEEQEENNYSEDENEDNIERLSTILEVSCESESPLKRSQRRSSSLKLKKQNDVNINKAETHAASDQNDVIDVDSIPIGCKPTNKMSFEELIEESLKKQDVLDMEHQKLKSQRKKPIAKKPFLLKNSKETSNPLPKPQQQPQAIKPPVSQPIKPIKDEPEPSVPTETSTKPKNAPRPFLKRGEGLKRYQTNPKKPDTKPQQPPAMSQQLRSISTTSIPQQLAQQQHLIAQKINKHSQSYTNINSASKQSNKSSNLHSKSTVNLKPKQQEQKNKLKPAIQLNSCAMPSIPTHTSDDELKEFETLEQYVDEHPSFRSSVSFVENILSEKTEPSTTKATKLNYMLTLLNSNNSKKLADLLEEEINELNTTASNPDDTTIEQSISKQRSTSICSTVSNESLLNTSDSERRRSRSASSSSSRVIVRKVKRIGDEQQGKFSSEINLKKKYSCFNYEDTSDFNVEDTDTEEKQIHLQKTSSRSNSQDSVANQRNSIQKNSKFDDRHSWADYDGQEKPLNDENSNEKSFDCQEKQPVVSQLMGKLFPSLKKQQPEPVKEVESLKYQPEPVAVTTVQQHENLILKQKLSQLEAEIDKFQRKNLELAKLKEKCESEVKNAEMQRKVYERQRDEEMVRLRELHDEEMRKLKLEKRIFEQYKQSIKEMPDRRERDEIDKIKKQLVELTEDIKLKESRWLANNNRMKERVEMLEGEKVELKRELQIIEKQRIDSLLNQQQMHHQNQQQQPQGCVMNVAGKLNQQPNPVCKSKPSGHVYVTTNLAQHNHGAVQQPSHGLMVMKRSMSEKSLHSSSSSASSTSSSSSCSSSSSASIGSTGSNSSASQVTNHLATSSNYFSQQQESSPQELNTNAMHQIHHIHSPNDNYPTTNDAITLNYGPTPTTSTTHHLQQHVQQQHQPRNSQQPQQQAITPHPASKSVKFKLDSYQTHHNYDETSQNTSNTSNSSYSSTGTDSEFVTTQAYGNQRQIRVKETRHFDDKHIEKYLEDGTTLTMFPNGTIKEVSPDKRCTYVKFFNGDRKEMNHDTGTETYFYAETNITQIIYSNGMQILKFPSGQIEKHHTNKTREITFPDKICKFIYPDGSEESRLPNGTCIKVDQSGGKVIEYPNKQREIHTKDYKRREYPDGSIKTVYTNGISETRYANGRTRIKDAHGNIISDKKP